LLVAEQVITEAGVLLERLADSGDIPVTKNSEASFKEVILSAVSFDELILEKGDDGLSDRQPFCHRLTITRIPAADLLH